jgi:hypothetical protein
VVPLGNAARSTSLDHVATFPQTKQPAVELTSGAEHERFDFAPDLFLDNLTSKPGQRQPRVNATPTRR